MVNRTAQSLDKFIVRLPDGMRDRIGIAARENKRTMNAEIVARLEASFRAEGQAVAANDPDFVQLRDRIESLEEQVGGLTEGHSEHEKRLTDLDQKDMQRFFIDLEQHTAMLKEIYGRIEKLEKKRR